MEEEIIELSYNRPRRFKVGQVVRVVKNIGDPSCDKFVNKTGIILAHSKYETEEYLPLFPIQFEDDDFAYFEGDELSST